MRGTTYTGYINRPITKMIRVHTWNQCNRKGIEAKGITKVKTLVCKKVKTYFDESFLVFLFKISQIYMHLCLFGFLTSSSTTRLYRGRAPRQNVRQFYVLPHTRQSWETMTSVSAGHIILTPTQPVGSGRPQLETNPRPPHQQSRALSTELPPPNLHPL